VPDLGVELKWIEPGQFLMGSSKNEKGRSDERQHQVTLSDGFWLGTYELTVAEWSKFSEASGYKSEGELSGGISVFTRGKWMLKPEAIWSAPGFAQTDQHPVVGVSWNDAMEFGRWLTAREEAVGRLPANYEYTLPTEAQWEYACRAGSTGRYHVEGNLTSKEIWYRYGNGGGKIMSKDLSNPVGLLKCNAWGLYDMHGNVFEWCRDWYSENLDDAVDPTGPDMGEFRVCRGGSWFSNAASVRSSFRGRDKPNRRGSNLGLRLSLSVKP
jgi:formylglycine-generating enzyme required for sulfatase activity